MICISSTDDTQQLRTYRIGYLAWRHCSVCTLASLFWPSRFILDGLGFKTTRILVLQCKIQWSQRRNIMIKYMMLACSSGTCNATTVSVIRAFLQVRIFNLIISSRSPRTVNLSLWMSCRCNRTVSAPLAQHPRLCQFTSALRWRIVASVTTNITQVWRTEFQGYSNSPSFNISWTGKNYLPLWVKSTLIFSESGYTNSDNFSLLNSTQIDFTLPLLLSSWKKTPVTLTAIIYKLGSFRYMSYQPGAFISWQYTHNY